MQIKPELDPSRSANDKELDGEKQLYHYWIALKIGNDMDGVNHVLVLILQFPVKCGRFAPSKRNVF